MGFREELLPWDSQPQEVVEVDHARWPGLTCVWIGSSARRNLINGAEASFAGSSAQGVSANGLIAEIQSGGGNGVLLTSNPDSIFVGSTATISVVRRCRDTTNRESTLFGYNSGGSDRVLLHAPFSDGNIYFDFGNSSSGSGRISTSFAKTTEWEVLTLVAGPTRGREIWRNGVRIANNASATATRAINTTGIMRIGGTSVDSADADDVALFVVSSAEWSEADIQAFGRAPLSSPWQLFAPRRIWVPQTAAGGLPTLGTPTFVPGSLSATGFRPRLPLTW